MAMFIPYRECGGIERNLCHSFHDRCFFCVKFSFWLPHFKATRVNTAYCVQKSEPMVETFELFYFVYVGIGMSVCLDFLQLGLTAS